MRLDYRGLHEWQTELREKDETRVCERRMEMKIPFKFMQCAYLNSVNGAVASACVHRFDAHNSFSMAG